MGSAKAQRRPQSDSGSSSSSSSAAPDVARGPASEGSFAAGLEGNSLRGQANEVDVQESRRLANEMTSLARKNAWTGVERKYAEMVALGGVIPGKSHNEAAQAAQHAGNIRGMQMRFRKARAAGVNTDADLLEIDEKFKQASIRSATPRPKSDKKAAKAAVPTLLIASVPFAPDARKAVEFARKKLEEKWSFNGMLPAGSYTVEHEGRTATFEVQLHLPDVALTV